MKKKSNILKLLASFLLMLTVQIAQAETDNLEELLTGKAVALEMKFGNVPAERLPDGITFRENEGSYIADFTKTGSDRKRKLLWKMMAGKFCMKPLLLPGADFACYKVSQKGNIITLKAKPEVKDEPDQMILTLK